MAGIVHTVRDESDGAYPNATRYAVGEDGLQEVAFEDTEHYRITRSFLNDPKRYLDRLFRPDDS